MHLSTTKARAAMWRAIVLWTPIFAWLIWCLSTHGIPSEYKLRVSLIVSAVVGVVLNFANWRPFPAMHHLRAIWLMRALANFAIPFAVSVTSTKLS